MPAGSWRWKKCASIRAKTSLHRQGNHDDRAIRKRFSPKSALFMVYRLACQSRIEADLIDQLCSVLSTFED
jgi:hypothetical protein